MSGNDSAFQEGDDFVAARLSIDVPTEGIANLREITQEIDRYRTSIEAAARVQDDFVRGLSLSAEAADRAQGALDNLVATMQRSADLQSRAASGSATAGGTAVPNGYVDPFLNARAGYGSERGVQDLDSVSGQIDNIRQTDPRGYINMQAARNNVRYGDMPTGSADQGQLAETANRIAARDSQLGTPSEEGAAEGLGGPSRRALAQQVMNDLTGGGSLGQRGMAGARSAASAAGISEGTLAGMGRAAGIVGGVATAGLAAYGMSQKGGEMYQDYKNQGLIRGGGAGAGFEQEMSVRTLAMNPFLNVEQSRSVIQAALTEGYSGKAFDTVTGYISHNLTEMNMTVADSVGLLRKNVNEGGQSIVGLNASLSMLKDLSQDGARTLPDLVASFSKTSGALINAGVSGPQAANAAMVAGQMWSGSQTLKGSGDGFLQSLASSPSGQAAAFALSGTPIPQGAMPGTLFARTGDGGMGVTSAFMKQLAQLAQKSSNGDKLNGAYVFQQMLQRFAPSVPAANDLSAAQEMYESLLSGKDPSVAAEKDVSDSRRNSITPRLPGAFEAFGSTIGGIAETATGALTGAAKGLGGAAADLFTGKWQGADKYVSKMFEGAEPGLANIDPFNMRSNVLDQIMQTYGSKGFEVLNKGKPIDFDRSNAEQMAKLASGEYTWRPKGGVGPGMTAASTANLSGDDLKNAARGGGSTQVTGSVTLGLTPEAQRLLQPQGGSQIQLTPHEQKANAGYGDAAPNNAPPGEGPLTRGMR